MACGAGALWLSCFFLSCHWKITEADNHISNAAVLSNIYPPCAGERGGEDGAGALGACPGTVLGREG